VDDMPPSPEPAVEAQENESEDDMSLGKMLGPLLPLTTALPNAALLMPEEATSESEISDLSDSDMDVENGPGWVLLCIFFEWVLFL
jgi:hypothetical protein